MAPLRWPAIRSARRYSARESHLYPRRLGKVTKRIVEEDPEGLVGIREELTSSSSSAAILARASGLTFLRRAR